jgi:hypothetical protein
MIGIVKTGDEHLTVHVLFSIIGLGNQIERTHMSLLQASNFRVTIRPERPAVSVLFKPTGRRYTYTGDLPLAGGQSVLFGAVRRVSEERCFAGCAHNVVLRKLEIQSVTYFLPLRRSFEHRISIGTYYKTRFS